MDDNTHSTADLIKSMEENAIKKKRLVPSVHKPYEWDADNPNEGIPWPDIKPQRRSKGPAFQRIENQAEQRRTQPKKVLDPFTGTYIIQHEEKGDRKSIALNYQPELNAYVQGDSLAGLRNKKRHARIMAAQEFLDDTKLDERTREQRRKAELKIRADEEYARAREAVKQKKMRQKLMQQRLAKIDARGQRGGFRSKSHKSVSSSGSVSSYASSEMSMSTMSSSRHSRKSRVNEPISSGSSRPSTAESGILFFDNNDKEGTPSRPNTADSFKVDDDEIAKWEGTRVKTPIWGNFGNRSGSAGHTPWNRIGSAGAKHFGGWLGNLRDLISRGGSRGDNRASRSNSDKEPEKPETTTPSPTQINPKYIPNTTSPSKSLRPANRRRKNRQQARDAPFEEALSNDGSMIFGEENSIEESVQSGVTERSIEFLGEGSSSTKHKREKKKKKGEEEEGAVVVEEGEREDLMTSGGDNRGTEKRADRAFLEDDDTVVSMLSVDSFGGGSIGSLTIGSEFDMRKKRKKKRKKKKRKTRMSTDDLDDNSTIATEDGSKSRHNNNISTYVNGPNAGPAPVATFEFIDDMSLASSMGTVRSNDTSHHDIERGDDKLSPLTPPPPLEPRHEEKAEKEESKAEEQDQNAGSLAKKARTSMNVAMDTLTPSMKALQASGRRKTNFIIKRAARIESYLIKKKMWKAKWRISGRENYNKSAGFTKASHDPLLQASSFAQQAQLALLTGATMALKRMAYASYLFVYMVGGEEAANTMGFRDFLLGKTMTGMDMIAAAGDGESALVMRALTQIKDRVKVESRDYAGRTALMRAVEGSCMELTDDELRDWSRSQRKQRVRFLRTRGSTPDDVRIIRAMRDKKFNSVLELLMVKGADLNAQCIGHVDEDVTALHIAAECGHVGRIKWLLAKGSQVDCITESKMTPLHFAAKLGKCDAATYLLKQDANMVAKNNVGWTPLHFAAHSGGTQMVKLLLTAGADKHIIDNQDRTPVEIAIQYGNRSSFEVLMKWNEEKFNVTESLDFLESKIA